MKNAHFLTIVGLLGACVMLQGCFLIPSPGGLEGVWKNVGEDDDPEDGVTSRTTTSYQFIGNQVTRTIEQVLRDVASGDRVTLLGRETGTYAVDETVEPHRMDIIGIQRTAYPSQVAFGGAAALLDMPADEVQTFFDEALGITFQPKGVYEKSGEVLRLRFGSAAEYPPDLEGGVVIRVERAGWFVKMLEWGTLAL